jgi:UDP-glucose 6-dehydrogenase
MLYDLAQSMGGDWKQIHEALVHDPRVGESHTEPLHKSGNDGVIGRGAAGHCFMKDFEAFRHIYESHVNDKVGSDVIRSLAYKNIRLLTDSKKDLDILDSVYGNLHEHPVYKNIHGTLSE